MDVRIKRRRAAALSPALLLLPLSLAAATGRRRLAVPPHQMFEAALEFAGRGDLEKVERALPFLLPVIEELNDSLGVDMEAELRRALDARDEAGVRAALSELVCQHMRVLLDKALEGRSARLGSIRLAYQDYLVLASHARDAEPGLAHGVEDHFKALYRLVRFGSGDSGKEGAEHVQSIERACSSSLILGKEDL